MTNDGGPAFPTFRAEGFGSDIHDGMSLRDWFAGQVIKACVESSLGSLIETLQDDPRKLDIALLHELPLLSYKIADAMLAEREKGNDSPG